MLRNSYRMLRSVRSRIRSLLQTPTQLESWISANGTSVIHPGLEFTGLPFDEKRIAVGQRCSLERDVTFWLSDHPGATVNLKLGDDVFVGRNTYIGSHGPISIGNSVLIGAYCYIISASHCFESRDIPIIKQGFTGAPIDIGEGAWLGTHVVVLPGVTIGRGAIVGAGSVVTRDIPPFEVWGGVPARFLKHRP